MSWVSEDRDKIEGINLICEFYEHHGFDRGFGATDAEGVLKGHPYTPNRTRRKVSPEDEAKVHEYLKKYPKLERLVKYFEEDLKNKTGKTKFKNPHPSGISPEYRKEMDGILDHLVASMIVHDILRNLSQAIYFRKRPYGRDTSDYYAGLVREKVAHAKTIKYEGFVQDAFGLASEILDDSETLKEIQTEVLNQNS